MILVLWILGFSLLGSLGAILAAAGFLALPEPRRRRLVPSLVSYATGTLLTAGLLGLIPHALYHLSSIPVLASVLVGLLLFFLLEKVLIWRHCHNLTCEVHGVAGPLLLIGDVFHNLTDGVIIAACFLSSVPVGIVGSLSIIAHEIPQEVGDFAILLQSGYSKRKALWLNSLSSLSTLPGGLVGYYALGVMRSAIPYAMAISAASFLYIALADLTPELHRANTITNAGGQFLLLLAGVGTIAFFLQFHVAQ